MITRSLFLVVCVPLVAASVSGGRAEDVHSLRLIPFPKQVEYAEGRFALDRALSVEAPRQLQRAVETLLVEELVRAGLKRPTVRVSENAGVVRLSGVEEPALPDVAFRKKPTDEDYALVVAPDAATIVAQTTPGLLHGVSTLCQLIRANRRDGSIRCLTIGDWPSIPWRAFQDDLTRGPSTKLSQLKRDVVRGATLKLNIFTYYMEYQFAFSKHPLVGPKDGSLTPGELRAVVEHAAPVGVHVLGNQQSFAHMEHLLAHEEYAHLRENKRTLSPVREETYQLLDDLYSDVLPILPFEFFNVCCDETWGLGTEGPSKALAERIGPGGVYVQHVRRVYDLVHGKYGKRMMMWGDIILKHPDKLDQIPKDVIMLTWGYGPRESFEDQIVPFRESGYDFFVCPGVSNWRRVLPNFSTSVVNIRNFVRDGAKHGTSGVLNTSWDDDGENLNGPNWYGFAWGAECAWNAAATPIEDFDRRVGAVLFGEPKDHFGLAIRLLSDAKVCGMLNRVFWADEFKPLRDRSRGPADERLEILRQAIDHLEACRKDATVDADLLDPVLFGARRLAFYHERKLNRLEAAQAYNQAAGVPPKESAAKLERAVDAIRRTRDAYVALRARWQELWLRENKPYAIDWSLERYARAIERYDQLLSQLSAARRAVDQGRPLPAAEDIGLALSLK